MQLIYGTKNNSKLNHMAAIFEDLPFELIGLEAQIPDSDESGNHILENAKEKARHYYKLLKRPVFSCDSGLYFDHLDEDEQPGVHIRRVGNKRLSDDEMIEHYSQIAHKNGGEAICRYKNAICLVLDENNIITYAGDDIASEAFKIVSKPHPKHQEGFPLDSLSVDLVSGQYYYDLKGYRAEFSVMNAGFKTFFKGVFKRPQVTLIFKGYEAILIDLYPEHAPETVKNFIDLIQKGYYGDKALCRIVPGRLIQSGDPTLKPEAWTDDTPGYILNGEFNQQGYHNPLGFIKGTLGMAMASYEVTPYATAGSFFIMNKDEAKLNGIVPAFGRVVTSLETIDQLNSVKTHTRYGYDAPEDVIAIEHISVETFGFYYPEPKKISLDVLNPTD